MFHSERGIHIIGMLSVLALNLTIGYQPAHQYLPM